MSTGNKMPLAEAEKLAYDFRALFADCYEQFVVAGSVRRRCAMVGDIEWVAVPKMAHVQAGLFGETVATNLLWRRADELVNDPHGSCSLAIYQDKNGVFSHRWGDKYRGVSFGNIKHEIFTATADTLGSQLAIRTGSAGFSKGLVTGLLRNGRRNKDGAVWHCEPCVEVGCYLDRGQAIGACKKCDGTGLVPVRALPVPTEEEFFALAGVPFLAPEKRGEQ